MSDTTITNLPSTASESEMNPGSYVAMDVNSTETKRLPAQLIAKKSEGNSKIHDLGSKNEGYLALDDGITFGKFPVANIFDSIAPAFDATVDYQIGQCVMYLGKQYTFKVDHPAGAWDASEMEATSSAAQRYAQNSSSHCTLKNSLTFSSNVGTSTNNCSFDKPYLKAKLSKVNALGEYAGITILTDINDIINDISKIYVRVQNNSSNDVNLYRGIKLSRVANWSQEYSAAAKTVHIGAKEFKTYEIDVTAALRSWATSGALYINIVSESGDDNTQSIDLSVAVYTDKDWGASLSEHALKADEVINVPPATFTNCGDSLLLYTQSASDANFAVSRVGRNYKYTLGTSGYSLLSFDILEQVANGKKVVLTIHESNYDSAKAFVNKLLITTVAANWSPSYVKKDYLADRPRVFATKKQVSIILDFAAVPALVPGNQYYLIIGKSGASGDAAVDVQFSISEYIDSPVFNTSTLLDSDGNEVDDAVKYITCWGDSLTAQGGWTEVLAEKTDLNVYNCGVGGEGMNTIVARQGGDTILVDGFTIPATVSAVKIGTGPLMTYFGRQAWPLQQGGGEVNPVTIAGVTGILSVSGSDYYFTRAEAGSAVTVDRPSAIVTNGDKQYNSPYLMFIFMGQNGGWVDVDDLILKHDYMIAHTHADNTIVLGLTSGTNDNRAEYETKMKAHFGRYYVSLREYLTHPIYDSNNVIISSYGLDDAGITPTSTDLDNIAVGKMPPSLLADSVHYTAACKTVIGNMLFNKCKELGIF